MKWRPAILAILICISLAGPLAAGQSKFSCRNWLELAPAQRIALVEAVIKFAKEDGVEIRLPTEYYAEEINKLIQRYTETHNEKALDTSLGVTFHTIAAMEGDWDDGKDLLEHAKKFMGEDIFKTFKEMYPEKYNKLEEKSRERNGSGQTD